MEAKGLRSGRESGKGAEMLVGTPLPTRVGEGAAEGGGLGGSSGGDGGSCGSCLGVPRCSVMNPREMGVPFRVVDQTPMQSSQRTMFWKVLQEDDEIVGSLGGSLGPQFGLDLLPVKREEAFLPEPTQSPRHPSRDSDDGKGIQVEMKNSQLGGNEPEKTLVLSWERVPVKAEIQEDRPVLAPTGRRRRKAGGKKKFRSLLRIHVPGVREPLQEWPLGPPDAREEPLEVVQGGICKGHAQRFRSTQQNVNGEVAVPGEGSASDPKCFHGEDDGRQREVDSPVPLGSHVEGHDIATERQVVMTQKASVRLPSFAQFQSFCSPSAGQVS
ncbi:hypothetical protein lerEdw1_011200 [Lerista edwardsae]|nr:hypothetical protein lerEdw1_011200 [Lerista edwardsae]